MSSFVAILTTIGSHEMDEIFIHADKISIKNLEQVSLEPYGIPPSGGAVRGSEEHSCQNAHMGGR